MSEMRLPLARVKYNVSIEDIKNMMSSGLPDEIIKVTFIDNPLRCQIEFKAPLARQGWWIRVERKIYGDWFFVDTFVDHDLVQAGSEWVEKHHELIDSAFEATRLELNKPLN